MAERPLNLDGILRRLSDNGVDFVVIGGVAAALRGSPLATFDLDICAPLSEANLPRILAAIGDLDPRFRFRPDKMRVPMDPAFFRNFKALNLTTNFGALDILGDLPGVGDFNDLLDKATSMNVSGVNCRVLDVDALIASKSFAGRAKDKTGLFHLEALRQQQHKPPE